jgi:hypothetical protein
MSENDENKWNPRTGYYSQLSMASGFATLEERMNWVERQQTKEREKARECKGADTRKFALVEKRVILCTHDWQPVHKWLHKEYSHCTKCGAIKHQDGTLWFFVDHHAFRLMIKKS